MRSLFLVALLIGASACIAEQQFRCDASTADTWLTATPGGFRQRPSIESSHIQPVRSEEVDKAVASLAAAAMRALTSEQAALLSGVPAPGNAGALRPWLVRAVFPIGNPTLSAVWMDDRKLVIFADGLGCAPFTKRPVVVWLEREPAELFVGAHAAL